MNLNNSTVCTKAFDLRGFIQNMPLTMPCRVIVNVIHYSLKNGQSNRTYYFPFLQCVIIQIDQTAQNKVTWKLWIKNLSILFSTIRHINSIHTQNTFIKQETKGFLLGVKYYVVYIQKTPSLYRLQAQLLKAKSLGYFKHQILLFIYQSFDLS